MGYNRRRNKMNNKLIGFEFTRLEGMGGYKSKMFVPLDKIIYVEELYEHDIITGKRTGKTQPGARIHLVGHRAAILIREDYTDILDKWLNGTNDTTDHPGTFDLSN